MLRLSSSIKIRWLFAASNQIETPDLHFFAGPGVFYKNGEIRSFGRHNPFAIVENIVYSKYNL